MSNRSPLGPVSTGHFAARQQPRGLRSELRESVYCFGVEFDGAGVMHITLVERELPPDVRRSRLLAEVLHSALVLSRGETLLTCSHCPNATRFLRSKCDQRHYSPLAA